MEQNKENREVKRTVKVININSKEGHEILKRCPILNEYSIFMDTIRKYQNQNEEDAIKKAIEECMDKGILVDYLQRKGSQVNNMLIAEYDYDLDIEVQREEAREEGIEVGMDLGRQEGIDLINKINALNQKLVQAGRTEEIVQAATDKEYQEKLFEEFGL